jgi:hypothetical protein
VQHDAPRIIHYLCLDVEGAERTILEPFDFEGNWEILAISVEGSTCDELLAERGYLRVENPFEPHSIDHYFIRPQLRMEYDAHVARLEQTREVPGPR